MEERLIKQISGKNLILTSEYFFKLENYVENLRRWKGLDLIAKSTYDDIYNWHIFEGLSIINSLKDALNDQTLIIDFGAGGGVFGVPLSYYGFNVLCVERNESKNFFIKNVCKCPASLDFGSFVMDSKKSNNYVEKSASLNFKKNLKKNFEQVRQKEVLLNEKNGSGFENCENIFINRKKTDQDYNKIGDVKNVAEDEGVKNKVNELNVENGKSFIDEINKIGEVSNFSQNEVEEAEIEGGENFIKFGEMRNNAENTSENDFEKTQIESGQTLTNEGVSEVESGKNFTNEFGEVRNAFENGSVKIQFEGRVNEGVAGNEIGEAQIVNRENLINKSDGENEVEGVKNFTNEFGAGNEVGKTQFESDKNFVNGFGEVRNAFENEVAKVQIENAKNFNNQSDDENEVEKTQIEGRVNEGVAGNEIGKAQIENAKNSTNEDNELGEANNFFKNRAKKINYKKSELSENVELEKLAHNKIESDFNDIKNDKHDNFGSIKNNFENTRENFKKNNNWRGKKVEASLNLNNFEFGQKKINLEVAIKNSQYELENSIAIVRGVDSIKKLLEILPSKRLFLFKSTNYMEEINEAKKYFKFRYEVFYRLYKCSGYIIEIRR